MMEILIYFTRLAPNLIQKHSRAARLERRTLEVTPSNIVGRCMFSESLYGAAFDSSTGQRNTLQSFISPNAYQVKQVTAFKMDR